MITLNEYKNHLVSVYKWPIDNTEAEIEKRRIHLNQNYEDEYLEKIINDTYSFIKDVLMSDAIERKYYKKDVNEDTTKSIYLFLHGGYSSDILYKDNDERIISRYIIQQVLGNNLQIGIECEELEDDRDDDILSYYYRYYIYIQNFSSDIERIKKVFLYEDAKRRYSCGSLLKKKKCNGRTVKVYPLDVNTAEKINRRVSACSRQNIVESHNSLRNADNIKVKILKLK